MFLDKLAYIVLSKPLSFSSYASSEWIFLICSTVIIKVWYYLVNCLSIPSLSILNRFSCRSSCLVLNWRWGFTNPSFFPFEYNVVVVVVVVVRFEHSHTFIASLDNHSTASGPASCGRRRPPGNAVSGHSSTMCIVVWWLSPQGQAGDAITPHQWRDSAHLACPLLRRFTVTYD